MIISDCIWGTVILSATIVLLVGTCEMAKTVRARDRFAHERKLAEQQHETEEREAYDRLRAKYEGKP